VVDDGFFWWKVKGNSATAIGTVSGIRWRYVGDSIAYYSIGYTANSQEYLIESTVKFDLDDVADYEIGDQLNVVYYTADPTIARVTLLPLQWLVLCEALVAVVTGCAIVVTIEKLRRPVN
jgi:hypothetical protein